MEKRFESKTYVVKMECDKCRRGFMVYQDFASAFTYPPKYSHKCNNCGAEAEYTSIYPHTEVVEVEEVAEPARKEHPKFNRKEKR